MAKTEKRTFVDPLLRKDSRGVFNLYRNRNEVGEEILRDFLSYELNAGAEDGFLFREGGKETGVISQCYGLLTLTELAKYNLTLSRYPEVVAKVNATLGDILERILKPGTETLDFDATPYVAEDVIDTYLETATLFFRILIEVRNLLYYDLDKKQNAIELPLRFVPAMEDDAERTRAEIAFVDDLLIRTMDFISGSALLVNGEEGIDYCLAGSDTPLYDYDGQNLKHKGWTFTPIAKDKHGKTELSLFHTYLAGEAYLSFYEFFPRSLDTLRRLRAAIYERCRAEGRVTLDGNVDLSLSELSAIIAECDEREYGIEIRDDEQELLRDFTFLRKNYAAYHRFNKSVIDAGRYVDLQFRNVDTTKIFFNHAFRPVTAEDIENSSGSDAMFNVLFAINIMMAAGVDLDYKESALSDEFYDKLQYSVPCVQRFFKKLTRDGRGDMYDNFFLKLHCALPVDDQDDPRSPVNQAKALRKQRIALQNLTPLIIKTYCTVSRYIIPYPQYDMRSYKDEILKKKQEGAWLWDSEEYDLVNNYNYIFALRSFYDYYEVYERPYSLDKAKYIEEKETAIAELSEELKSQKESFREKLAAEQKRREEIIADYEESLRAERVRYEEKRAPIEKEIDKLISDGMRFSFDKMLREALAVIIEENGRAATGEEELRVLFKRAFTSYLPEAFSAATELLSEQNDEMAEAVVDEAIVTLVQDQIRRNRT